MVSASQSLTGDGVSSTRIPGLADSTGPTHALGNKPTLPVGLGSRMIYRKKAEKDRRRVSTILPKGIVSVTIRVVFPPSRCCVLLNP